MRQGQQNRRGRGRSNNNNNNSNRKSQNPMTRSFESTGPDVKLRGTPSHVAEKYMSLARDALSSGDPVLAENYMQHAEHYNRIIMTFRDQQMSAGGSDPYMNGMGRPATMGGPEADADDFGDDEGDDFGGDNRPAGAQPDLQSPPQQMHQPRSFDQPQRFDNRPQNQHQNQRRDQRHNQNNNQGFRNDRNDNRFDRPERHDRQDFRPDRNQDRNQDRGSDRNQDRNQDRGYDRGQERSGPDRDRNQDRGADRAPDRQFDRTGGEPRGFRDERPVQHAPQFVPPAAIEPVSEVAAPRRRERPPVVAVDQPAPAALSHEQPEFLRRPVRRPRVEKEVPETPAPQASDDQD